MNCRSIGWVLGAAGDSCTGTCEAAGGACVLSSMRVMQTEEEGRYVASILGVNAAGLNPLGEPNADAPGVWNGNLQYNGAASECTTPSTGSSRFCCCGTNCPLSGWQCIWVQDCSNLSEEKNIGSQKWCMSFHQRKNSYQSSYYFYEYYTVYLGSKMESQCCTTHFNFSFISQIQLCNTLQYSLVLSGHALHLTSFSNIDRQLDYAKSRSHKPSQAIKCIPFYITLK